LTENAAAGQKGRPKQNSCEISGLILQLKGRFMNTYQLLAVVCRWTARVGGALLVLLIVMIGIGEGMPNPFTQPLWSQIIFLALALIMMGILVGWRWELAGGILSLVGFCLGVIPLNNSPRGLTGFYFALALPGALYVISALVRRYGERRLSA
jgi:hypothetical protein